MKIEKAKSFFGWKLDVGRIIANWLFRRFAV